MFRLNPCAYNFNYYQIEHLTLFIIFKVLFIYLREKYWERKGKEKQRLEPS